MKDFRISVSVIQIYFMISLLTFLFIKGDCLTLTYLFFNDACLPRVMFNNSFIFLNDDYTIFRTIAKFLSLR